MTTIWKYPLQIKDSQEIEIPEYSNILTAQIQKNDLYLWVLIHGNPDEQQKIKKKIEIYGTGDELNKKTEKKYISTFQPNPYLVFHVFEVIE